MPPVLNTSGSPYHSTSRWLTEVAEPVKESLLVCTVREAFQFADGLRDVNAGLQKNYIPRRHLIFHRCTFGQNNTLRPQIHVDRKNSHRITDWTLQRTMYTANVQFQFHNNIHRESERRDNSGTRHGSSACRHVYFLENKTMSQWYRHIQNKCGRHI